MTLKMNKRVVTETPIRVRYGETDQMGHAYYGNYLDWLEVARGEWCRARGFLYKSLEERGMFLPCVEVQLRYKQEIQYDQDLVVRVWVPEIRRVAIKFEYEIYNKSADNIAAEGFTLHVLMGSNRKAMSIPEDVMAWLHRDPADCDRII